MVVVIGITAAKTCPVEDSISLSVTPGNAGEEIKQAPVNPKFVEYQLMKNKGLDIASQKVPEGRGFGLVPSPVDLSHIGASGSGSDSELSGLSVPSVYAEFSGELPSSYDLRSLSGVTSVKDQGNAGTCWAFATYGSLESYFMPDEELDFSENNMKNLLSNTAPEGFDFSDGGNQYMSTAYLARWGGPVDESDDPYSASSSYYNGYPFCPEMKHVQEVDFVPGAQGISADEYIKQAVLQKGAVYSTMYMDSRYFNSGNNAYYYSGSSSSNHAITIVGWDDNFPANNFLNAPPGNGAFIVKNSWGTAWGEYGYFYISYYDSQIGISNAVFTAEGTDSYDFVYQYDPLGWVTSVGYQKNARVKYDSGWAANVFTAGSDELLKAVSFYTPASNAEYELYIYTDVSSTPASGTLKLMNSGTISETGYHTISLSQGIPVTAGQKFSVVLKLRTPAYYYPIVIERPYSGYSSKATAHAGESFISSSGTSWQDLTDSMPGSNVCIKAFTAGSSVEAYDLAITGISAPDFLVQGDTATVQVTVMNQGSSYASSILNLTDEYDLQLIGTVSVGLDAGNSAVYTFEWYTKDEAIALHFLNATVKEMEGESDLLDNSMTAMVSIEEETHDVAVTAVSTPDSVTVGNQVTVGVTVKNEGNREETFYVLLTSDNSTSGLTDDIEIGNQSIILGAESSAALTFIWDTGSSGIGLHTLTATAEMVNGETDTADNSKTTPVTVNAQSPSPEIYVGDISFKETGPHLKAVVNVLAKEADSSIAPAAGAMVDFTFTYKDTGEERIYSGVTDSSGTVEFQWKSASGGEYEAKVKGISLSGYIYCPVLDVNNPAFYLK